MVRLETHWPPLLQDGLMRCVQPLPNSRRRVVVVVLMTLGRVVVVVCSLVGFVVFLLAQEVGMKVSADKNDETTMV